MLWVDFTDGLTGFTLTLPSLIHPATFPCKSPLPFREGPLFLLGSPLDKKLLRFVHPLVLPESSESPEKRKIREFPGSAARPPVVRLRRACETPTAYAECARLKWTHRRGQARGLMLHIIW